MPDCAHISGSLHTTTRTEVLIETIKDLRGDLRWCDCILSTQYHTVSVITHDESASLFFWKVDTLKEYWDCILNALIKTDDDGKGHRPDLIVDDGGDMTLLINEVNKTEELFLKYVTIPDTISTEILSSIFSKPLSDAN